MECPDPTTVFLQLLLGQFLQEGREANFLHELINSDSLFWLLARQLDFLVQLGDFLLVVPSLQLIQPDDELLHLRSDHLFSLPGDEAEDLLPLLDLIKASFNLEGALEDSVED